MKDVFSLGCTNKFFALITTDDTLWKRRLAVDYNFTGSETARTSGWKFIYKRLRNPRVFVWGEKDKGRLGLPHFPKTTLSDVPFPVELHLPGVRVVSLAASGVAFHALDADGSVHIWGTLNGISIALRSDGFSEPCKTASTPLKLRLPAATRSISCGRLHAMTLDANSTIWNFRSWGRPFRLVSPSLDCSSLETTPAQIECGWAFCTVLMKSGDVYAWWPFGESFKERYAQAQAEMDQIESTKAIVPEGGKIIPCHTWEMKKDPVKLPVLPDLPDLPETGLPEGERKKETRLIKIAAFDNCLMGLTNKGHVLKIDGFTDEDSVQVWRYLPYYSEIAKVKEHAAFRTITDDNGQERPPQVQLSSDTMHITHISAHFTSFFAYSSSMVLKGDVETTPETLPTIIPELQNKSVISVVLGDYHFGALTSSGKLLTWGQYSKGALGLGDPVKLPVGSPGGFTDEQTRDRAERLAFGIPPNVTVPTEVRFDYGLKAEGKVERYCFAAAASGWHTSALVIDLAGDDVPPEDLEQHLERAEPRNTPFGRGRLPYRGRGLIYPPVFGHHMPPPGGNLPGGDA